MATRKLPDLLIEDAKIVLRNFEGRPTKYNPKGGIRSFSSLLDPDLAATLSEDGWSVKHFKIREEEDIAQAHLPITVGYKIRPPAVFLITSRGREHVTEDNIDVLDWVDIAMVDLIVQSSFWSVNGEEGFKAYLKSMYVTINEDALSLKYATLDDLPARAGQVVE
jgi:hypothetical protein